MSILQPASIQFTIGNYANLFMCVWVCGEVRIITGSNLHIHGIQYLSFLSFCTFCLFFCWLVIFILLFFRFAFHTHAHMFSLSLSLWPRFVISISVYRLFFLSTINHQLLLPDNKNKAFLYLWATQNIERCCIPYAWVILLSHTHTHTHNKIEFVPHLCTVACRPSQ
jgi:hypothetical protein